MVTVTVKTINGTQQYDCTQAEANKLITVLSEVIQHESAVNRTTVTVRPARHAYYARYRG